jgi:LysM repeat protein
MTTWGSAPPQPVGYPNFNPSHGVHGGWYAIEPGSGGSWHIYSDGSKIFVATPPPPPAPAPPPMVIAPLTPAAAAGIPADTYKAMQNTVKPLSPAAAEGIPADTYAAMQNTVKPLSPAAAEGIPADTYAAMQNTVKPLTPAAAAGIPADTYQAEQNTLHESTPNTIAGIPNVSTTPVGSTPAPTLQEPPGRMEVTPGMTYWDLANRHGWSVAELVALNPGIDPHNIPVSKPGSPSFINIPQATPAVGSTSGNPATAAEASSVGPSSSVYNSSDSKIKTAAANLKARFTGWGGQGTDSPDPLRTVVEAVEHPPKINTNPINHDTTQSS